MMKSSARPREGRGGPETSTGRAAVLRFGVFSLDPTTGEVRRRGRPVALAAQPAKLLVLLTERAGELVTRDEIRRWLWGDEVHVDFDKGISAAVRQIRRALDETAGHPRYLETVPRRGYRFIAPVQAADGTSVEPPRAAGRPRPLHPAVLAVLVLLVVAVPLALRIAPGSPFATGPPSLAVLPFRELSADPADAWLGLGLHEELNAELSRRYAGVLDVIAPTSVRSYSGDSPSLDEVARQLDVDYVIRGTVRRQGETLRVSARLVRTGDGSQLWAGTYDRPLNDVLAVQRELGRRIAQALALHVVDERSSAGSRSDDESAFGIATATDPRAYEAYLRGRHALADPAAPDPEAAIRWMERALARDPTFALAWVRLAEALNLNPRHHRDVARQRAAVDRALALDDELPEAHLMAAGLDLYHAWDFASARRHFERALELHPAYARAHHAYAAWFSAQGRHREALEHLERARTLDPRSLTVSADAGWFLYFARRWQRAARASRRTLDLAPGDFSARRCLLLTLTAAGDLRGAADAVHGELVAAGGAARRPEARAAALRRVETALAGGAPRQALAAYWDWRLAEREADPRGPAPSPAVLAEIHMGRGDHGAALAALERAAAERSGWILPFLSVHPLFDPLRDDPRFRHLLARIQVGTSPPHGGDRRSGSSG